MNKETKIIEDIYLAAALLSYETVLVTIDRSRSKHQKFEFMNKVPKIFMIETAIKVITKLDISVDEFETLFLSNKVLFPPSYPDNIRRIKAIIYS